MEGGALVRVLLLFYAYRRIEMGEPAYDSSAAIICHMYVSHQHGGIGAFRYYCSVK